MVHEYLIVNSSGTIENVIVCASDDVAKKFGAIPSYAGAKIGDLYSPPPPIEDRIATLETDTADLNEALNMILTGVTE